MNPTPREKDKLLVAVAAMVAERRLARGVRLNHPEAVALITDYILEGARDGKSVAELMRDGATIIARDQVMEGVPEMIREIQVEATLVTVHEPIRAASTRISTSSARSSSRRRSTAASRQCSGAAPDPPPAPRRRPARRALGIWAEYCGQ